MLEFHQTFRLSLSEFGLLIDLLVPLLHNFHEMSRRSSEASIHVPRRFYHIFPVLSNLSYLDRRIILNVETFYFFAVFHETSNSIILEFPLTRIPFDDFQDISDLADVLTNSRSVSSTLWGRVGALD